MRFREGKLVYESRQEGGKLKRILKHCDKSAEGRVRIPNGVNKIDAGAFEGCKYVTNIDIPNSITEIEDRAFAGSGIISLNLPELERIKFRVCADCKALRTVSIHEGLKYIDANAFEQCVALESLGVNINQKGLVLPIGFEELGDSAFRFCKKLEAAELPQTVKKISYAAFYCSGLQRIKYPRNATIGHQALSQCNNLTQYAYTQTPSQSMGL